MIGVLDSGVGGLCSYSRLRELLPSEDVIYLADRLNSPYGEKSEDELVSIVEKNVRALEAMGADRVLIACCTASGIYKKLSGRAQDIAFPIIAPAAEDAVLHSGGGNIAVISTEFTAKNHFFKSEIQRISKAPKVFEISSQMLVSLVELGAADGALFPRECELLDNLAGNILSLNSKALILGCTHFSHVKEELRKRLHGVHITDTAKIGAEAFIKARAVSRFEKHTEETKEENKSRAACRLIKSMRSTQII